MTKQIKKARLNKRSNRKLAFKKFIENGCTDINLFLSACRNDENLLIYTCLDEKQLEPYIEVLKDPEKTLEEKADYLKQNQPFMNETEELFEKCIKSMSSYLKGFIDYNSFLSANAEGSAEDFSSEYWAKYSKVCNFYRIRWFHPEQLSKPSTVQYTPVQYKEFIYLLRASISGDRRHRAFLATQDEGMSIFRLSLDSKVDCGNDNDKSLIDVISDEDNSGDMMLEASYLQNITKRALELSLQYNDSAKYHDQIAKFYEKQDPIGFDKKTVLLGKIFLYKAGLISGKILLFIKSLSSTYKTRYNISQSRLNAQISNWKNKPFVKPYENKYKQTNLSYKDLIFHKRGELKGDRTND